MRSPSGRSRASDAAGGATEVRRLAERHGIDEVMVSPIGGSYEHEPADATPGREQTLELLAAEIESRTT